MIKKIRTQFFLISMLLMGLVILMVIFTINVLNRQEIERNADSMLQYIASNGGTLDRMDYGRIPSGPSTPSSMPERYFTIFYNDVGMLLAKNVKRASGLEFEDLQNLVNEVRNQKTSMGHIGDFKFIVTSKNAMHMAVFIDISPNIRAINRLSTISLYVAFISLLVIGLILWFLSGLIVKPHEESLKKEKRFISDASHEIKTPLSIILADADILEMEYGPTDWTDSIKNQTKRLDELVKDLLFLSRLEERKLERVPVDAEALLQRTIQSFAALEKLSHHEFKLESVEKAMIDTNPTDLERVYSVLIDNAMKYAKPDTPITIELKETGRGYRFSIANEAILEDSKNQNQYFERFYRGDQSRNSEKQGYGLGLSILYEIAKKNKWTIKPQITSDQFKIELEWKKSTHF
ncbi:sensor histidine kinase [Guggenheimella bovis]